MKLTASEGYVYTNGGVWGKEIYLGVGDSPDTWREVPITEVESQISEIPPMFGDIEQIQGGVI